MAANADEYLWGSDLTPPRDLAECCQPQAKVRARSGDRLILGQSGQSCHPASRQLCGQEQPVSMPQNDMEEPVPNEVRS